MVKQEFFTFREYMKKDCGNLTACAEDYLEMIYRLSVSDGFTRTNDLASSLNVQPPSVTKMVQKLAEMDLIKYEKYGIIILTKKGSQIGKLLLERHNIIEDFLKIITFSNQVLDQTEKIEHTIDNETLEGIKNLVDFFKNNSDIMEQFKNYCKTK